jgi:hypothetical protein
MYHRLHINFWVFPPSLKTVHQQSKMMGFHKIFLCLTVRFLVMAMSQESFGAKFSMDPVSILWVVALWGACMAFPGRSGVLWTYFEDCHNFCILFAKNNIDLIKTSLNLFYLHLFQCRISNFDEIWFTFKKIDPFFTPQEKPWMKWPKLFNS